MNILSQEDLEEFREIFGLVDSDNSGKIDADELGLLCKKLGLTYTDKQLEVMVKEIDVDRNGEIDFEASHGAEFIAVMSRQVTPAYTNEDLKNSFKVFSPTTTRMPLQLVEKVLTDYTTEKVHPDKAAKLVKQMDTEHRGEVDYADFINVMTS